MKDKLDFEIWLMEYHCENNPEILDDMLPDCFNDWVCDLDVDDWIRLGNKYSKAILKALKEELPKEKQEKGYLTTNHKWSSDRGWNSYREALLKKLKT